jgi:predicted acylesterase/phospholipase RssA
MNAPAKGLLLVAFLVAGCTHANRRLNGADVALESRQKNHTRADLEADIAPLSTRSSRRVQPASGPATAPVEVSDDGYFVGLALSGGGSRSANFSAACMFQLQRFGLLQRVDYISSVSGGSLAGAYYCGSDKEWNPAEVQARLTHGFATDMIVATIQPWNSLALILTAWDRSDLLAATLQQHLYSRGGKRLTFADLRADRPHLLLNATDLQSGRRFIFCNESFDEINSDLSAYPIANAVAASAAVPVLMHHVTLRDYSTIYKQYRHLIDGGVTDNLGVQTLVETYDAQVQSAQDHQQSDPYPNGAILFVIDARTRFDAQISDKPDVGILEGLAAGAGLTSTALLNRVSSATLAEIILQYSPDDARAAALRDQIQSLEKTGLLTLRDRHGKPVRIVHIALSRLNELSNLPFQSFSERVNNIATYFNIDPTESYHLYQAAELLVNERFEPRLRELARELGAAPAAAAAAAPE